MNLDYVSLQQVLYGPPNQNKLNFLNSRREETNRNLGQYQSVHTTESNRLYNLFNSEEAIRRSKILLSQTESVMNNDNIFDLTQQNAYKANIKMQRYIMANPELYRHANNQTIDGYNSSYTCQNSYEDPRKRIDYMNVTSGIITEFDKTVKTYYTPEENELTAIDKSVIYKSWRTALNMLADDIDPTDIDNL